VQLFYRIEAEGMLPRLGVGTSGSARGSGARFKQRCVAQRRSSRNTRRRSPLCIMTTAASFSIGFRTLFITGRSMNPGWRWSPYYISDRTRMWSRPERVTSNQPMHPTGAPVSKEALICARPSIKTRCGCGALQKESPAGDWQSR